MDSQEVQIAIAQHAQMSLRQLSERVARESVKLNSIDSHLGFTRDTIGDILIQLNSLCSNLHIDDEGNPSIKEEFRNQTQSIKAYMSVSFASKISASKTHSKLEDIEVNIGEIGIRVSEMGIRVSGMDDKISALNDRLTLLEERSETTISMLKDLLTAVTSSK